MLQKRTNWAGYAFIAPNLIGFMIFIIFPILFSLAISFADWDYTQGFGAIQWNGGANYLALWSDAWFTDSLRNTVIFAFTVAPLTVAAALFVSVLVDKYAWGKKGLRLALLLPYVSNIVAVSVVWVLMYAPFGPFTQAVKALGWASPPAWLADYDWALAAVILMTIWAGIGYSVLIYTAAIQGLPKEIYEAAEIDGSTGVQGFFKITVPLLSPTTFFLVVTNLVAAFQVFGQIMVMTRGGPGTSTHVLSYYIYTSAFTFYNMGYASAVAWVLFALLLAVTLVQWKGQKHWVHD